MKKNTKFLLLFLSLVILIILCRCAFDIKTLNYTLRNGKENFKINESYIKNKTSIKIESKERIYLIDLFNQNDNKRHIVDKIYYYKDDLYECILPIINNKIETDFMCYKEDILYDYHILEGENTKLDNYVNTITEYNIENYKNNYNTINSIGTVKYFTKNKINNLTAITTYKGIIINGYNIDLFVNDVYNNKLSTFVKEYYVIADYTKTYEFQYFYIVDLFNKTVFKIKSKYEISLDSYIQGIVDDKVYIYDKDNENQYELNIDKRIVNLISSNTDVKYYKNNKWEKISKIKANKEVYFDYTSLDNNFSEYDLVVESDLYYYLMKKSSNGYDLYRVNKNQVNIYKFISNIPTCDITAKDNYIYYAYNNKLYYYSDKVGLKAILEDTELEFNDTIKYYIY